MLKKESAFTVNMRWEYVLVLCVLLLAVSCAKVPKESNISSAEVTPDTPQDIAPRNRTSAAPVTANKDTAALAAYCTLLGGRASEECEFAGKSCDLWELYVGECLPPFVEEENRKAVAFIEQAGLAPQHVKSIAIDKDIIHSLYEVQDTTMLVTIEDGTITQALRFGLLFPPLDYAKSDPNYQVGAPVRTLPPAFKLITPQNGICGTSAHNLCKTDRCVWRSGDSGVCT
jgi:hypothetical protein